MDAQGMAAAALAAAPKRRPPAGTPPTTPTCANTGLHQSSSRCTRGEGADKCLAPCRSCGKTQAKPDIGMLKNIQGIAAWRPVEAKACGRTSVVSVTGRHPGLSRWACVATMRATPCSMLGSRHTAVSAQLCLISMKLEVHVKSGVKAV